MRLLDDSLRLEEFEWIASSILDACSSFRTELAETPEHERHQHCLQAFALAETVNRMGEFGLASSEFSSNATQDIESVWQYVHNLEATVTNALFQRRQAAGLEPPVTEVPPHFYEFADNDLLRLQTLINELRDLLKEALRLDDSHRARLLKRLERLQGELHKTVSDLDRFWGLLGDAGAAIGKFGEDTKPFLDRLKEFVDILRRTERREVGSLPSDGVEKLEPPSTEAGDSNEQV